VRDQIDSLDVKKRFAIPKKTIVVADVTFDKHNFGVCIFRSPRLKKNLIWQITETETAAIYQFCRGRLKDYGCRIIGAVIDGKPGIPGVFSDIPVQMCHFHQVAIITRYLTRKPKLPAGIELRRIALALKDADEKSFRTALDEWHKKWSGFMDEKTVNPITGRKNFTHKRLRSAFRSLSRNFPYLFTYQKYPHLNLPNTTNSLDGTFSHVKNMLNVHRGQNIKRKLNMINEILSK
jgi:hypothetical protein